MANTKQKTTFSLKSVVLHCILAVGAVFLPNFSKVWALSVLFIGIYQIISKGNRNNEAALWSAYYVGLEMVLRTTQGSLFYEIGKYSIILFLCLGVIYNQPKRSSFVWLLFILFLIPSLLLTYNYESARFALSGPVALAVAAFYFSERSVSWFIYRKILLYILLPIISFGIILTIKTPDLSTIEFSANSMFATTGGAGPVHVSAVLGAALLILIVTNLIKHPIFVNPTITIVIILFLAFRLFLSFSRSGLYALILALGLVIIFMLRTGLLKIRLTKIVFIFVTLSIFWIGINNLTDGMAYNRYTGKNTFGEAKEDISTGRVDLFVQELTMFSEHPFLGIGTGNVSAIRLQQYNSSQTSHTEYSRLLAEHGIWGLGCLIILLGFPLLWYKRTSGYSRIFFIANIFYSLFIQFSASTRTALPLFLYGLSFLMIKDETISMHEKRSHD